MKKEARSSQLASLPLRPSPNFSFRIMDTGSFSQAGESASAPILAKVATPFGLHVLSSEAIWSELLAQCKLVDLLAVKNLLFFLQCWAEELQSFPQEQDSLEIWAPVQLLLSCTAPIGCGCHGFCLSLMSLGLQGYAQGDSYQC